MTNYVGGYILTHHPLMNTRAGTRHTMELDNPVSQVDLDAINSIQATPWRINTRVLDVMREAYSNGIALPSIPMRNIKHGAVARVDDAVWAEMNRDQRAELNSSRRATHSATQSLIGQQQAFLDRVMVAQEMRDGGVLWFPHSRDFRGRIYPIPTAGPHPQADDVGKALIEFAEGVPLQEDGLDWLLVRAANTYGHDKLSREDKVAWTNANLAGIISSAWWPTDTAFWQHAADPWQFLATCFELHDAFSSVDPRCFMSHLPVQQDGTCNGLQHLSAMALDRVGAAATNLTGTTRSDIYQEIADDVTAATEERVCDNAVYWKNKGITRATVKRAVMTTPYGVTKAGVRRQLVTDGHADRSKDGSQHAAYLGDLIDTALSSKLGAGRAIMAWLQQSARRLADAGVPFDWTTPTGSRCRQAYHAAHTSAVSTLVGRMNVMMEMDSALNARKQASGSAPNVVHSFDAAHLALTVNACVAEGIGAFSMVHDSYGTHAGHTTTLCRVLREQFVDIYKDDWLQRLYVELQGAAPSSVTISTPPARGQFDIYEVLHAPYFFS